MPFFLPFAFIFTLFLLFLPFFAIKCFNCRTTDDASSLKCASHCEGDLCALWKYREMSTDLLVQGCLSGADFRSPSSRLKMGCRRNGAGAQLCLCRNVSLCNANIRHGQSSAETNGDEMAQQRQQLVMPADIQCHSHTWASFFTRRLIRPPLHGCQSDLCFFTETNISRLSLDGPLRMHRRIDSSVSQSCGPQREFNFDLLLGPLWPGNGLHSDACYQLEDGRGTNLGCSCSNNGCNRLIPYPIDSSRKRVKCHLDGPLFAPSRADFCLGHFCFTQRMPVPDSDGQWAVSSGCLSSNESAARTSLKIGYRNILGVEQWLCGKDFCNSNIGGGEGEEANDWGGGEKGRGQTDKDTPKQQGKDGGGEGQKEGEKSGRGEESSARRRTRGWHWPTHFCWAISALYFIFTFVHIH
ncbi:hypothetical protein niasHT_023894 [Heterodera trifolii]|uniref:DUF7622 domain-containing protein n=1 Tax=Heterodera trifolii TaxID=157864 RepID=A0ABD2JCI2_9BILA